MGNSSKLLCLRMGNTISDLLEKELKSRGAQVGKAEWWGIRWPLPNAQPVKVNNLEEKKKP